MNARSPEEEHIYIWLLTLGQVSALPDMSADAADQKLSLFATLLADEFDQACFCRSSLAFVARRSKFFPAFSEVCTHLADWRREQRPYAGLALSGPADLWEAKVAAERAAAASGWNDPQRILAAIRSIDGNPLRRVLGRMLGSAVALYAPHLIELVPAEFRARTPDETGKVIAFPGTDAETAA